MQKKKIFVTQPTLPPLGEFIPYLEQIWDNKILTNGGPFHEQLEQALCEHFNVRYVSLFTNGTLALITALRALNLSGEVITTPYSFVATSHALLWNGLKPVFVDIDPHTLNLDARKIVPAISSKTTAILPVHCYGHPCDVDAIREVAETHDLKVVYDAAHAFGVDGDGGSILQYGDLSVLSFHATKVFNTFEGGAIICHDGELKKRIDELKNFGLSGEAEVAALGINGKMSEVNAAMGLLQLKEIDSNLARRKLVDDAYRHELNKVRGIHCVDNSREAKANYAYFPILVNKDYPLTRDELDEKLKLHEVYARRYFYPLISDFAIYKNLPSAQSDNLPVATQRAQEVLCLPIYPSLELSVVKEICALIANN